MKGQKFGWIRGRIKNFVYGGMRENIGVSNSSVTKNCVVPPLKNFYETLEFASFAWWEFWKNLATLNFLAQTMRLDSEQKKIIIELRFVKLYSQETEKWAFAVSRALCVSHHRGAARVSKLQRNAFPARLAARTHFFHFLGKLLNQSNFKNYFRLFQVQMHRWCKNSAGARFSQSHLVVPNFGPKSA